MWANIHCTQACRWGHQPKRLRKPQGWGEGHWRSSQMTLLDCHGAHARPEIPGKSCVWQDMVWTNQSETDQRTECPLLPRISQNHLPLQPRSVIDPSTRWRRLTTGTNQERRALWLCHLMLKRRVLKLFNRLRKKNTFSTWLKISTQTTQLIANPQQRVSGSILAETVEEIRQPTTASILPPENKVRKWENSNTYICIYVCVHIQNYWEGGGKVDIIQTWYDCLPEKNNLKGH